MTAEVGDFICIFYGYNVPILLLLQRGVDGDAYF
jgi:hypothetical protein